MKNPTHIPLPRRITRRDVEVARNIRKYYQLRKQQNQMTQTTFANSIGVTQSSISQMISSPPTMAVRTANMLSKVAAALDVPMNALDPELDDNYDNIRPPSPALRLFKMDGGNSAEIMPKVLGQLPNHYYGVVIDALPQCGGKKCYAIANKRGVLVQGKMAVVQMLSGEYLLTTMDKVTPQRYKGTNVHTNEAISIPIKTIQSVHPIDAIEF